MPCDRMRNEFCHHHTGRALESLETSMMNRTNRFIHFVMGWIEHRLASLHCNDEIEAMHKIGRVKEAGNYDAS